MKATKGRGAVDTHGAREAWLLIFRYRVDSETEPAMDRSPTRFVEVLLGHLTKRTFAGTNAANSAPVRQAPTVPVCRNCGPTGSIERPDRGLSGARGPESSSWRPPRNRDRPRFQCFRTRPPPQPPALTRSRERIQDGSFAKGSTARTICRRNACGLRLGCGARVLSAGRVGADRITSRTAGMPISAAARRSCTCGDYPSPCPRSDGGRAARVPTGSGA